MDKILLTNLRRLGHSGLEFFKNLGRAHILLAMMIISMPALFKRPKLIVAQIYSSGVLSLLIIIVSGLFVGMVLGLQGFNTLSRFGAEESLGSVVAVALVTELGPVVTGLLFAGRAGSAMAAEIGLMKVTEQLSAMEMMAVDPIKRVLSPRLLGGFISMPFLAVIFSAVGIIGGYVVGVGLLGVDEGAFWSQMQARVDIYEDVENGILKTFVFGLVVSLIAIYEGNNCIPTSEGVSRATTRTVVHSSVAILGFNFILTALMFGV